MAAVPPFDPPSNVPADLSGIDVLNVPLSTQTGDIDPTLRPRGGPGVGPRAGFTPQQQSTEPLPEGISLQLAKGRAGGEKGGFAQFMERDAARLGREWNPQDAAVWNLVEGTMRGLARSIVWVPEETLSLADATLGEVGRKLGLWEGRLPRHFIDRWVNAPDYESVKRIAKLPEGQEALQKLADFVTGGYYGQGERIGFTGAAGKTGQIMGEFAGIGLGTSAAARKLGDYFFKGGIGGVGPSNAVNQQLQQEAIRDASRPTVAQPWIVRPDGVVKVVPPTVAGGRFSRELGQGVRLTGAEIAQIAARSPVRDSVNQVLYGTGLGAFYGGGEALFPNHPNAGAYASMLPLMVPAAWVATKGAVTQAYGLGKNVINGTAGTIKSVLDRQGINLPTRVIVEETAAASPIMTPFAFNPRTGQLEYQQGRTTSEWIREVLRNVDDRMMPGTPAPGRPTSEALAEQIVPLLEEQPAQEAFKVTQRINALYEASMYNAYQRAHPGASKEEIAAAVQNMKFEWSLGEQFMQEHLLKQQARIESQATGSETSAYLALKARNTIRADNFAYSIMGTDPATVSSAPSYIYDALNGHFRHVVTNLQRDLTHANTMLEQLSAPGTILRGTRSPATRIKTQQDVETAVRSMEEHAELGTARALFPEQEAEVASLRQILQGMRTSEEELMTDLATSLGLRGRNVTMGRMQPLRDAVLESTGLDNWVNVQGRALEEHATWNKLPEEIRHALTSKYADMDFTTWKNWRSQISSSIQGWMMQAGGGRNAMHLTNLKTQLDNMMWGVNGQAVTPGRMQDWARLYEQFVIQPFETMAAARVLQPAAGSRPDKNIFFYQIPEERVAGEFLRDTQTVKEFQSLFGPDSVRYGPVRRVPDPAKYQWVEGAAGGERQRQWRGALKGKIDEFKAANPRATEEELMDAVPEAYINLPRLEWNPREYQLLRDAALDKARPHVLGKNGVLDPAKIRAYIERGNNREVFRATEVPDPTNPDNLISMEQLFLDNARITEGYLQRQQHLNTRQQHIEGLELNRVLSKLAKAEDANLEGGVSSAELLIDRAMQNPELMGRIRLTIQEAVPDPALSYAGEYALDTQIFRDNLQRSVNNAIFNRFNAKEIYRGRTAELTDNPFLGARARQDFLAENETMLTAAMGEENFSNLVLFNELMKRVYATFPRNVGRDIRTTVFEDAFQKYSGVTLQGYSARIINMLEGRIGPRTSAVWLAGRAAAAGQLRRLDDELKRIMADPSLVRLLTQKTANPGEVSVLQANRIRTALWYAGIPDLTEPSTVPVEVPYQETDRPTIPPGGRVPAPRPSIMPNVPPSVTPDGPPTSAITPPAGPPTAALAPRGRPLQLAGPPAGPPAGPTDFAALFPYDELGQAVARRDQGGIGSLRRT